MAGKWNKHVDAWDALKSNEFFSLEGFVFAFRQMVSVSTPPNRFTPEFQIYKKYKDWEIRRYLLKLIIGNLCMISSSNVQDA